MKEDKNFSLSMERSFELNRDQNEVFDNCVHKNFEINVKDRLFHNKERDFQKELSPMCDRSSSIYLNKTTIEHQVFSTENEPKMSHMIG